jgi:hypothetical protein
METGGIAIDRRRAAVLRMLGVPNGRVPALRADADHHRAKALGHAANLGRQFIPLAAGEAQRFRHHRHDDPVGPPPKKPIDFAFERLEIDAFILVKRSLKNGKHPTQLVGRLGQSFLS